jgi:hypothetical protein
LENFFAENFNAIFFVCHFGVWFEIFFAKKNLTKRKKHLGFIFILNFSLKKMGNGKEKYKPNFGIKEYLSLLIIFLSFNIGAIQKETGFNLNQVFAQEQNLDKTLTSLEKHKFNTFIMDIAGYQIDTENLFELPIAQKKLLLSWKKNILYELKHSKHFKKNFKIIVEDGSLTIILKEKNKDNQNDINSFLIIITNMNFELVDKIRKAASKDQQK